MKKSFLLIAFCTFSTAIYAQVGINTVTPGTTLDVNGAITNRETAVAVAGNAVTIPANVSQVQLTGSATGGIAVTAPAAPNAGQRLIIYNNTTGGFAATLNGNSITSGQAMEFAYSNGNWRSTNGGVSAGNPAWNLLGNSGTLPATNFLGTTDNQDMVFRTNNTEKMRVQAGGNVGISTSTPNSILDLGPGVLDKKLAVYNSTAGTDFYGFGLSGGQLRFHVGAAAADAADMVLNSAGSLGLAIGNVSPTNKLTVNGNSSIGTNYTAIAAPANGMIVEGNVGIGTSAPLATSHIINKGTAGSFVGLTGLASNIGLRLENNVNGNSVIQHFSTKNASGVSKDIVMGVNPIGTSGNGVFVIARDNASDFLIDLGTGHTSVGTFPSASTRLDIADDAGTAEFPIARISNLATVATGNKAILGFNSYNGGGATWGIGPEQLSASSIDSRFNVYYSNGGNYIRRVTILPNGNLGINNTSPAYMLDVVGDINASGSVRAAGVALTSDARLKRNINTTSYGLNTVMALRPVEYEKKNSIESNDYNRHEIGFIAQEVEKIIPSIVTKGADANKTLAVSYTEIIPILTKAIQDQQKQIESLEARLKTLEEKKNKSSEPKQQKEVSSINK